MKPTEWRETDIEQLIKDEAEESLNLEFKRSDALESMTIANRAEKVKTDISKDVSSFANSAGGIIIYGIEEDEQPPHKAKAISPIDPAKCSKERLEQVINSRIQPHIQGLRIDPVPLSGRKVSYLVNIPQSFTAHQACDKKYYKRFNFESVPMEDYEIRQAMNRQMKPRYIVKLIPTETRHDQLFFIGKVENFSDMVGRDVSIALLVPQEMSAGTGGRTEEIDGIIFVAVLKEGRLISVLGPLEIAEVSFNNTVRIPDPIPSQTFPAIVRVFDQFGQAHQAQFDISLMSTPRGQIVGERHESRDDNQ